MSLAPHLAFSTEANQRAPVRELESKGGDRRKMPCGSKEELFVF